jgi:hypothetical protein
MLLKTKLIKTNAFKRLKTNAMHVKSVVFFLVMTVATYSWAFSFMIKEPQINSVLSLTFPYETQMGTNRIRLTNPQPHFYESSQEIGITLKIAISDQVSEQTAQAKTMLRGGIRFDSKNQQLQLVKPKIASLDWIDKPAAENQDLVNQVTQLVGQDMPVIVLLDVKQLTGNTFTPTLSDIKIKQQGIEVSF